MLTSIASKERLQDGALNLYLSPQATNPIFENLTKITDTTPPVQGAWRGSVIQIAPPICRPFPFLFPGWGQPLLAPGMTSRAPMPVLHDVDGVAIYWQLSI